MSSSGVGSSAAAGVLLFEIANDEIKTGKARAERPPIIAQPQPQEPAASKADTDFEWSYTEEPHASRRKAIIAKYGSKVHELYGHDPSMRYKVVCAVVAQLCLASLASEMPIWAMLVLAWTVGGVINHSMTLAMHEISHNLAFKSFYWNRVFGCIANLPLGIPAFVSFKRYHSEHHRYQGQEGIDVDIPTAAEGRIFNTAPRKALWWLMQPLFYAFRPMLVVPKKPNAWEGINWLVQFIFDAAVWYFLGTQALAYLVLSTLLGMGLHPMAGHFVAEHYTFQRSQETYSYYGPLNWFSHNVGYHNEHHDFPFIPGCRLRQLRELAPEFYDDLPSHASWVKVIWCYIFDPTISPFSRVKRDTMSAEDVANVVASGAMN